MEPKDLLCYSARYKNAERAVFEVQDPMITALFREPKKTFVNHDRNGHINRRKSIIQGSFRAAKISLSAAWAR
jgi:hypothetical protein